MRDYVAVSETLCEVHHILSAPRRWHTILLVAERGDDWASVSHLARAIAANEQDLAPEQTSGEPYRGVYNALSQTHLPALADAGILEYDGDRQKARRGEQFPVAMLVLLLGRAAYRTHRHL